MAGDAYQFQYFVNDLRGGIGPGRDVTLKAGGVTSQPLHFDTDGQEGGLGQYVYGMPGTLLHRRLRLHRPGSGRSPSRRVPSPAPLLPAAETGYDNSTCTGQDRGKKNPMKISARNALQGTVQSVTPGAVNTEVVIETAGGERIVSIITKELAETLGLVPGKAAYAVIKASDVLVATDE